MKPIVLGLISVAALLTSACGPAPQPAAPAPQAAPKAKLADLAYMLPEEKRVEVKQVEDHLFGHDFLPGGTVGHYKDGARQFDVAVADLKSGSDAALALLAWKKTFETPKVVAHFGGYAGKDGAKETFIFVKDKYICAVVGLNQADADQFARTLATRVR
jgi:hypothetical protein